MKEVKEVNGKSYTIENGIVKIAGKELSVYRPAIMPADEAPTPIYNQVKDSLPKNYTYVRSCGAFMPREIAEIAADQMDQIIADGKAKKEKNIPGLDILQDAICAVNKYHNDFEKMMNDEFNDGVNPPKNPNTDLNALRAQYPVAAAYLKAESWSRARHDVKSNAGSRAMIKIESGENAEAAIVEMESEWSKNCEEHMFD